MTIVSSVIRKDSAQKDGRRHIIEVHTGDNGIEYPVRYMAGAKDNVNRTMNNRASKIEDSVNDAITEEARRASFEKEKAIALLKITDAELTKILETDDSEEFDRKKQELIEESTR